MSRSKMVCLQMHPPEQLRWPTRYQHCLGRSICGAVYTRTILLVKIALIVQLQMWPITLPARNKEATDLESEGGSMQSTTIHKTCDQGRDYEDKIVMKCLVNVPWLELKLFASEMFLKIWGASQYVSTVGELIPALVLRQCRWSYPLGINRS